MPVSAGDPGHVIVTGIAGAVGLALGLKNGRGKDLDRVKGKGDQGLEIAKGDQGQGTERGHDDRDPEIEKNREEEMNGAVGLRLKTSPMMPWMGATIIIHRMTMTTEDTMLMSRLSTTMRIVNHLPPMVVAAILGIDAGFLQKVEINLFFFPFSLLLINCIDVYYV